MKSLVIYYSQSGNTKKIADAIVEGIKGKTGQCDIKHLKDVTTQDWLDYDLIGAGSSVWSSCPNVRLIYMIRDLPAEVKGKHAFFYCTHGILPGRCVARGVQPMLDAGLTVLGWKDWFCGASVAGHGKPWFSDGHPDDIDLAEARFFGEAMAEHSQRVSAGHTEIIPKLPSLQAFDEFYGTGHPFLHMPGPKAAEDPDSPNPFPPAGEKPPYTLAWPTTMDYVCQLEGVSNDEGPKVMGEAFRINPDKCIHCHRCVRACWCDNIDGSTDVPTFKSQNCETCLFCEGVCPTGALEFAFRPPMMTKEQADRIRSGESGADSFAAQLDYAEAMGNFRRLQPLNTIGYETPWEVVTSHPRHKIVP